MNFLENITFRRTRVQSEPTNEDSDIISQTLNYTSNSMPDISDDEEEHKIKTLNDEIQMLKSQLNSAHKEIEILTLENSKLKQTNEDLVKKNTIYKKITDSPLKHRSLTPKKNTNKIRNKLSQKLKNNSSEDTPTPPSDDTEKPSTSKLTQGIR